VGLRLLAFGFIFAAALLRDLELRNAATRAATFAERRRVAQDLHDGLAQDLAFIAAHGAQMAAEYGDEHPLTRAARHALAVSRDTITELSDTASQSPRETLEAIAHELGARFGAQIIVDVEPDAVLAAESRNQIGRITREAIANAARHGGAHHIHVSLKRRRAFWLLRIVDDGSGFGSWNGAPQEGFGITSMRERAAALGGTFSLGRAGSRATVLEVRFR
jgi:signal transduction histidine kinase